jgi:hypothetical protein
MQQLVVATSAETPSLIRSNNRSRLDSGKEPPRPCNSSILKELEGPEQLVAAASGGNGVGLEPGIVALALLRQLRRP